MNLLDLARSALADRTAEDRPRYRWRVSYPDGRSVELCALPEISRREVEVRYPGASIEALPDGLRKPAAAPKPTEADADRRRAKALAMLADNPTWRQFVVVEAGEPVVIGVAISGLGYGEIEIPAARYDVRALLALLELLDRHGCVGCEPPIRLH